MLPLDKRAALEKIAGMLHFRITTTMAPGVYFVTDQFADDETAAITAHADAFTKHHPELYGTYATSWVLIPAKADDPAAIGGRPA